MTDEQIDFMQTDFWHLDKTGTWLVSSFNIIIVCVKQNMEKPFSQCFLANRQIGIHINLMLAKVATSRKITLAVSSSGIGTALLCRMGTFYFKDSLAKLWQRYVS